MESERVEAPRRSLLRRAVGRLLFVLGGSFLGLALLILAAEGRFIYFPEPYVEGAAGWDLPARSGGRVEEVELVAADGVRLHGWYGRGEGATHTLLYFHGNGGNLRHRAFWIAKLLALPLNVFCIDYRGYGKSGGSPDEAGLYRDARAAWDHLVTTRGIPPGRIVIYGKSLGGGPATWLAEQVEPAALVLQSTFTSAPDMGNRAFPLFKGFPLFPLGLLMRTRFPNLERVARIRVPSLFIHSAGDELIPVSMGEALHAASAGRPKRFRRYGDEGHNELVPLRADELVEDLRAFLALE